MALSDRKMPFWDAVTAAQEHALSGDKDRAINALVAARREAAESGGYLSEERTALLRALIRTIAPGHEDLLEDPPNMAPAVQRIAVSGIGRSGTTLIYQQLAKLLLLADRRARPERDLHLAGRHPLQPRADRGEEALPRKAVADPRLGFSRVRHRASSSPSLS